MVKKNLETLFNPKSIAVVGATEKKLKWGSIVISNILYGGYKGTVYPVSPSSDTVYGLKAYKSLKDIPGRVDVVFIATPAITVLNILHDCVDKEIHNVVVISSGFSEVGDDGVRLEKEVTDFAMKHSINLVGPNTMGLSNVKISLFATGGHPRPKFGGISIIAQSGNVGNQIMLWAELEGFGISKFVGSGNEAVLRVEDYLEYLNCDDDTSVILIYLEGVDDGRKFLDIAKNTVIRKPVIALKAGRTEGGSRAAASHTGAMAGSFKVFESVMRQSGIMMAMNPTELLELSAAFDSYPLPRGNRVGIVTLGGGWGVITADECEEHGLYLPPLPEEIKKRFDEKLPPFWSRANPVDLVGHPDVFLFKEAIELMVASEVFDAVIVLGLIGSAKYGIRPIQAAHRLGFVSDEEMNVIEKGSLTLEDSILDTIMTMMNTYHKPIYPVTLAAFPEDEIMHTREGSKYKVIIYRTPEMAVFCLSKQYQYSRYLQMRLNKKKDRNAQNAS
jgi:acyl-CoA synthetase (NDP forming)